MILHHLQADNGLFYLYDMETIKHATCLPTEHDIKGQALAIVSTREELANKYEELDND